MKNMLMAVFLGAAGLLLFSGPLLAHHGRSNYDVTGTATVKGTVTEFEWVNPHALIHLDACHGREWRQGKQKTGLLKRIARIRCPARQGWSKNTVKVGDEITSRRPLASKAAATTLISAKSLLAGRPCCSVLPYKTEEWLPRLPETSFKFVISERSEESLYRVSSAAREILRSSLRRMTKIIFCQRRSGVNRVECARARTVFDSVRGVSKESPRYAKSMDGIRSFGPILYLLAGCSLSRLRSSLRPPRIRKQKRHRRLSTRLT